MCGGNDMVKKERLKDAESEEEAVKKPIRSEGGKLIKEGEAEAEAETEAEAGCKTRKESESESEDESVIDHKLPIRKEDEAESEEEEEEEEEAEEEAGPKKKKKKTVKADGISVNPEESGAQSTSAEHTTTPGEVIHTDQNVFVPSSSVEGRREQSTPMGKSVEPDLMKSPLFVGINKQLDGIRESIEKKIDSIQKSVDDRLNNIKKDVEKIEKFYTHSFYKAIDESMGPEGLSAQPLAKQIEEGKVHFRSK
jgi:hypothetical protein